MTCVNRSTANGCGRITESAVFCWVYPQLCRNPKTVLATRRGWDSAPFMIHAGFLDAESRRDLIALTCDGSAAHRLARRANALVLLDEGMSCAFVAKVLFLDDDTIRT